MKSFTDIIQSKKLAEILPLESADMFFLNLLIEDKHRYLVQLLKTYGFKTFKDTEWYKSKKCCFVPCWSLTALLNILPSATLDSSDNHCYRLKCNVCFTEWYDNSIDACVAMIEKLHELKKL